MTTRFLTVQELKDYVGSTLVTKDTLFEEAILTAEAGMDSSLVRRIELVADDAVASSRSYPREGWRCGDRGREVLYIHDCTSITSVVDNGATLVAGTDYLAEPLGGIADDGESWPYYKLRRLNSLWYPSSTGGPSVAVTTDEWAWPVIPPMAKTACRIIAKDVLQQGEVKFGWVINDNVGGFGTRENRIVRDFFTKYAHPFSMVMA